MHCLSTMVKQEADSLTTHPRERHTQAALRGISVLIIWRGPWSVKETFGRLSPGLGRGHVRGQININQSVSRSALVKAPWLSSDGQRPLSSHSLPNHSFPGATVDLCLSQNRCSFATSFGKPCFSLTSCFLQLLSSCQTVPTAPSAQPQVQGREALLRCGWGAWTRFYQRAVMHTLHGTVISPASFSFPSPI